MSTPQDPHAAGGSQDPTSAQPQDHPTAPGWGAPQPGPGYGPAPGYPPGYGYPYAFVPPPPQHPDATTSMTLGLISVIGGMFCYLPIFLAPFAWIHGRRVLSEIDAEPARWSGRSSANVGYIMGIVGTVMLILGLLAILAIVGILIVTET